jgi:hypothetical protein
MSPVYKGERAMAENGLDAWLDAMPIDDVRRRIERIEQELSDLRALERMHEGRHHPPPQQPSEY